MLHRLIFILAAYALTTSIAFATGGVIVTPVAVTPYTSTAQNVMATATFEGRLAAQSGSVAQGLYYQRAVTFSQAQMASASRSRMAGAVASAAALAAAMLAVGYFIDSITGDIYTNQGTAGVAQLSGRTYKVSGSYCQRNTVAEVLSCHHAQNPTGYSGAYRWRSTNFKANGVDVDSFIYDRQASSGVWFNSNLDVSVHGTALQWASNSDPRGIAPTTATDQQIHDAVRASPEAVREALHHPDGRPRVVQPMPAIMDQVAAQYRTDTAQPLAEGQTETPNAVDSPSTTPTATQYPAFCAWASKMCEFVDWMRAPPDADVDVDLPETQIQPVTWVSGLGTGTCPAPRSIPLSLGTYEMSWQPVCELALGIKALLLVSASLMAAYILSGAARNA